MSPDPWQEELLRSRYDRVLLNCSRQSGKSQVAAALAIAHALFHPARYGQPALVLLLSPTLRQSGELFRDKVKRLYNDLGRPVAIKSVSALTMELVNGSRIISLPGEGETIRGYSGVTLAVIDEAAQVSDSLYFAVRPMLAISKGVLVVLSTPWGKRGWFYDEWIELRKRWKRIEVSAQQCPRISRDFLKEERLSLGERWFRQEYCCSFEDTMDAVFSSDDINAAVRSDVKPLWG
jgi:hypothetical protein